MCGIAGFIDSKGDSTQFILKDMTDSLIHRGPDASGYEIWENNGAKIGFGHRRLSIIDLSPLGSQPMSNDHGIYIIFNGEIYNYQEIREELLKTGYSFRSNSDTEVILNAYKEWGIGMLQKFIGMFSLALFDKDNGKVILVRDRAGVKPMYYYNRDHIFLFASELKAFHKHPYFEKKINPAALKPYLQYGYVPAPHCIYQNTQKLNPGHYLEFDLTTSQIKIVKYWDVADYYNKPTISISEQDAIQETEKRLLSACQYRMVADVPVGVFLSGGYDSTAVTSILQKNNTQRIKTFTIGFEDNKYNEAGFAKKVAAHLGTDHHEYYCTVEETKAIIPTLPFSYDEPFGDSSAIPTILVSRFARQHVTVALSADAGDEIFAGYNKYSGVLDIVNKISRVPKSLQKTAGTVLRYTPETILKKFAGINDTSKDNIEKIAGYFINGTDPVQIMNDCNYSGPVNRISKFLTADVNPAFDYFNIKSWEGNNDILKGMLAVDYISYMSNDILTKVDRATMSVSLEGREPLLDQNIVEWVATLPSDLKIRKGVTKYLLKEIVHKNIPRSIMERPKMGFGIPIINWFREDLKYLLEFYLSDEALSWHGYFDKKEVKESLKQYYQGANERFVLIWYILMFQMWYEKWVK